MKETLQLSAPSVQYLFFKKKKDKNIFYFQVL